MREHLAAHAARPLVRVAFRMRLGEGDGHLHGPAGLHRVPVVEQALAQRHAAHQVFEDLAQLALGAHCGQALVVAAAVGGRQLQCGVEREQRDVFRLRPALEFGPGNLRQVRHHRVGLVTRFLLQHGQHRADVLRVGREGLRLERHLDIGGPAGTVGHVRRNAAFDVLAHLRRRRARRRGGAGAEQRQQHQPRHGPTAMNHGASPTVSVNSTKR